MFRGRFVIFGAVLLLLYVGSYLVLSRRAFGEARSDNSTGFYFFQPQDTDLWRYSNGTCIYLYYPLLLIERWLGTGQWPSCEPMWGLSTHRAYPDSSLSSDTPFRQRQVAVLESHSATAAGSAAKRAGAPDEIDRSP